MKSLYYMIVYLVLLGVGVNGVQGGTMVSGTVFCDQCKDGQLSLFDYPLSGIRVTVLCPGSDGEMMMISEDTTNMFGSYGMSFQGTPDLSKCFTQILGNNNGPGSSDSCGSNIGPPKPIKLMFSMFNMAMYSADPLISQPSQPMSYCSRSRPSSPVSLPPPVSFTPPAVDPGTPVVPSTPPKAPAPVFRLPPMPWFPPWPPMPPALFQDEMACPYEYWMKPEYKCYWRAVNPDMPVALVFGPVVAEKYGDDMTLYKSLEGRGDPYKTLLRESVTSLLNSYNTFHFSYNPLEVFHHFNEALAGSNRTILLTALRFMRANSGHGQIPCKLTPCH